MPEKISIARHTGLQVARIMSIQRDIDGLQVAVSPNLQDFYRESIAKKLAEMLSDEDELFHAHLDGRTV